MLFHQVVIISSLIFQQQKWLSPSSLAEQETRLKRFNSPLYCTSLYLNNLLMLLFYMWIFSHNLKLIADNSVNKRCFFSTHKFINLSIISCSRRENICEFPLNCYCCFCFFKVSRRGNVKNCLREGPSHSLLATDPEIRVIKDNN